jgi:OmpA-OmpF porin, OOP family
MRRSLLLVLVGMVCFCGWSPAARAAVRSQAVTLDAGAGVYFFDGREGLKRAPFFSLGMGYNLGTHWAIEGVAGYLPAKKRSDDNFDYNIYTARLDLVRHFFPEKQFVPYLSAGLGGLIIDPERNRAGVDKDGFIDWGLGFKFFATDNVALRVDARHYFTVENPEFDGPEYQNFSATAGLEFQFGGAVAKAGLADSDKDGIIDSFDRCPGTPAGVAVDAFGCPMDSDRDGVYDVDDKCPATPPGTTVDPSGCPADSDHDGVNDSLDKCPATPAGQAVDASGCPQVVPAMVDSDQDGVADADDKCPGTPSGVPVNSDGCARDSDGDMVYDIDDKCPGTPAGVAVDATGCPVPASEKAMLTLSIEFASGKSAVPANATGELDKAAAFIASHATAKIVVEGHTDSVGTAGSNLALSEKRAESVREALINRYNVQAGRITAKGYGETQPIGDNSTPEGRMANRRVVVRIAE